MTSNLNQQAREALLRALPHLGPRRRELLTSWLMGEPLTSSAWYDVYHEDDVDLAGYWSLLTLIPRLIMFGAPNTISISHLNADVIANINQAIDDIESRATGP